MQWISTSEKLPPKNTRILICYRHFNEPFKVYTAQLIYHKDDAGFKKGMFSVEIENLIEEISRERLPAYFYITEAGYEISSIRPEYVSYWMPWPEGPQVDVSAYETDIRMEAQLKLYKESKNAVD